MVCCHRARWPACARANADGAAVSEHYGATDVFLGLDVGKSFHHAVALARNGQVLLDEHLTNDEAEIVKIITELRSTGRLLLVVDQPSDIGAFPVAIAPASGAEVAYLPGLAMRRIADLHRGSAKSDRKDALVIAQAARTARTLPHALRAIQDEGVLLTELLLLCSFDYDLAVHVNRTTNRLRALLTRIHPSLERVIGPCLRHPAVLDLVQLYPSPDRLEAAGRQELERHLLPQAPKIGAQLAADIESALKSQSVVVPGTRAAASVLLRLAEQLQVTRRQREEIAEQVTWIVEHHPLYPILASMPGVGVATSARILTEISQREFPSAGHLAAFAGIAPVTRRSGTSIRTERRNERGNRALKRALRISAWTAIQHDAASRVYFDRKDAEGKRPKEAIAALTRRRLDVLYAMMRDARPYRADGSAATAPVEPPPVRRIHRANRRPITRDPEFLARKYEWFVARLRTEGTFLFRTKNIPGDLNKFRLGLRDAARDAGMEITTSIHGDRFFAERPDFKPSEAYMRSLGTAMTKAVDRELGGPLPTPRRRARVH